MMSAIILIAVLLAILHFVYESIVLPSIRMRLRDNLFRLRDELRRIRIDQPEKCDRQVFLFLDTGICRFLNKLSLMTFALKHDVDRAMEHDPSLKNEIERRLRAVESCDSAEFRRIYGDVHKVLTCALLANSGAWFFYLIPIALAVCCFSRVATAVKELLMMPSRQSETIFSHQIAMT